MVLGLIPQGIAKAARSEEREKNVKFEGDVEEKRYCLITSLRKTHLMLPISHSQNFLSTYPEG